MLRPERRQRQKQHQQPTRVQELVPVREQQLVRVQERVQGQAFHHKRTGRERAKRQLERRASFHFP